MEYQEIEGEVAATDGGETWISSGEVYILWKEGYGDLKAWTM